MGDEIRAARESLHLSTQAAAATADISPGYLFKLESGYVGTPSPRVLHRLSGVLGISYWNLMDLAGYAVPDDHAVPAVIPAATPAGPPSSIAKVLEEIRDELKGIRRQLETARAQAAPPAGT